MKSIQLIKVTSFFVTVLVLLLGLGQLQRFQVTPTIGLYLHDVVVGYFVLLNLPKLGRLLRFSAWPIMALVLIGWNGLSLVAGWSLGFEIWSALLLQARLAGYLLAAYLVFQSTDHGSFWVQAAIPGMLTLWFGLLQIIFLPDLRQLWLLGWDDHLYRLVSTQFDPGYAGAVLVLTWIFLQDKQFSQLKWWPHVFFAVGIALTFSRASWLMLGVAIAGLSVWQRQRWLEWGLVVLILTATVILYPRQGGEGLNLTRTSTLAARSNQATTQLRQRKPTEAALYVGSGLFSKVNLEAPSIAANNHATQPDNWLITLWRGWGIIGLLLALGGLIHLGLWQLKHLPLWGIQTASLLIFGLFNNLFQPFVIWIWLLSGLALWQLRTTRDS